MLKVVSKYELFPKKIRFDCPYCRIIVEATAKGDYGASMGDCESVYTSHCPKCGRELRTGAYGQRQS